MVNTTAWLRMPDDTQKQAELDRMKRRATALFGGVSLVFVFSSMIESRYAWVSFVRATAEAAMVGALADWFAVTALFRHPLNLKIPHTAIIPNRKDSFGESFGHFVQQHFLSNDVIVRKLRSTNGARRIARWISQPDHSQRLAKHAAVGLAGAVQVIRDEDVQSLIERRLVVRIQSIQVAPLLGNLLALALSGHRQQELLYGLVSLVAHLVKENKDPIRDKISRETPWWLPWPIDDKIYQRLVNTIEKTLRDVESDPHHPLYDKFNTVFSRFVEDLKHSPDVIMKGETIKEDLLQHPIVQDFSSSLWGDIKTSLLEPNSSSDADIRLPLQRGIMNFGSALLSDEVLLDKIDRWMEEAALHLIREYGHEVSHLISQTIKEWDAEAASRKIELQIGKDLQFIRINGTIVGGLAGLVIHVVSLWL